MDFVLPQYGGLSNTGDPCRRKTVPGSKRGPALSLVPLFSGELFSGFSAYFFLVRPARKQARG